MNNDNLIPQNKRTKSEQREIARKGGKASGEARNYAKSLRQALEKELQAEDGKANGYEKIGRAIIARAIKGDVRAAALIFRMSGEELQPMEIQAPPSTIEIVFSKDEDE